jgi:hypothetical protein
MQEISVHIQQKMVQNVLLTTAVRHVRTRWKRSPERLDIVQHAF